MEVVHFFLSFSYLLQKKQKKNRENKSKYISHRWFTINKSKTLTTFDRLFYKNECTESLSRYQKESKYIWNVQTTQTSLEYYVFSILYSDIPVCHSNISTRNVFVQQI